MDAIVAESLWLAACGAAVLLARVGMAMYNTGQLRAKNVAGGWLRNAADICLNILLFWAAGRLIVERRGTFWPGAESTARDFFLLTAVLMGGGIVVGALAERCRLVPSLVASVILGSLVIPLAGRWAWMCVAGYRDVGGASVIHVSGAVFGLVAARVVGPRGGKYNHDGSTSAIPGHSTPMVWNGALLMLAGWIPYLIGFSGPGGAALVAINALLAAAAGGVASLVYTMQRYHKADVHTVHGGILGALVAVSAAAPWLANWQAAVVGAVAGVMVPIVTQALDRNWKIDDPGGGIGIHGAGGVWGVLAAGIFAVSATRSWIAGIAVQLMGLSVVIVLAAASAVVLMVVLKATTHLRVRPADEYEGLDVTEHDMSAYPDFHQTMIK